MTDAANPRQGIQSVELAMTIVEAIERGLGPMSLTQIASVTGMGPSKVHRYLVSLCRIGLITQSRRSGLYDLGPAMRRIGVESLRRMDEVGWSPNTCPTPRDRPPTPWTSRYSEDNGPVLVRSGLRGLRPPHEAVRVGATLPLLTSSVGRVYLAYLPESLTAPVLESQLATVPGGLPASEDLAALRAEVLSARG